MDYFLKETRRIMRESVRESAGEELLELLSCHFQVNGKMNRPKALALLAHALEADLGEACAWAAALEIFHNGSLIHDDLQDGDILRRGAPSLWRAKGKSLAMNAGTFLMLNAQRALDGLGQSKRAVLADALTEAACAALEGQCLERRLNRMDEVRSLRGLYFQTIRLKTGALFSALAGGAGFLARMSPEETQELENIYGELGALFQLQDDILDLYGDNRRDMQGNDIKEGKVSFLILKHIELYHYDFEPLRKLLYKGREETERGKILALKEQFVRDGTLEKALEELFQRCEALANQEFPRVGPKIKEALRPMVAEVAAPLEQAAIMQNLYRKDLSNALIGQARGGQL